MRPDVGGAGDRLREGRRSPSAIPTWETVFTAMFMHASIIHIGGNMLFLWIFGNNVEDSMGPVKYFFFYILGGVAALALQVAIAPNSTAPTLGASGAIAAVLGGYIVLYPRARVLTLVIIILFFTVIELPALVMLGIWFAEQALFARRRAHEPDRRRRRRGLLRPHRRVRVRRADDQAAGDPAPADPAPHPGLLTRMRLAVLTIALLFIAALGVLTVRDIHTPRRDAGRRARDR